MIKFWKIKYKIVGGQRRQDVSSEKKTLQYAESISAWSNQSSIISILNQ